MKRRVLVTGGSGFMGSHFVRHLLRCDPDIGELVNLDKLTYASGGDDGRLADLAGDRRYRFVRGDVGDAGLLNDLLETGIDAIVHYAGESHVDRGLRDPLRFTTTNCVGTHMLLEAAARHMVGRFVHVSTDEVFGSWDGDAPFLEDALLRPTGPYSASKAAGELMAFAYHSAFGLPVIVVRPSNNYGPGQHSEKFVPKMILAALDGRPLTIHGDGSHLRDWIHAEDCARGVHLAMTRGVPGRSYNLPGGFERSIKDVAQDIVRLVGADPSLIRLVPDRPANDRRYRLDGSRAEKELGFRPLISFEDGLRRTVSWYEAQHRGAPFACAEDGS